MGSKVDLFAAVRRDRRVEGCSIRELAERYHVHRRTVRHALASAQPPERKTPARAAPVLGRFAGAIDAMLREDLDAPRKQRHTARRVWVRLAEEHGAVGLSYSTVRDHVRKRRPLIAAEAGRFAVEAMVPQVHGPGEEAEVDFGEAVVEIAGERRVVQVFQLRLSCSGKAVHRAFPSCSQEAFLEGHVHAFERIGGVPTRHVRYDNLTAAVTDVVFARGRVRVENQRWVVFRSHYGFDPFYCLPGEAGAHEKGGVEGEVGRFRRQRLVPVPKVASLDELNELFDVWDQADEDRRIGARATTVGEDYARERPLLAPLPSEAFDPGQRLTAMVSKSSLITVRSARYSVPARYVGRRLRVSLRAAHVVVLDGGEVVARHPRIVERQGQSVDLDHYLEVLARKPGALPGSAALAEARRLGLFTPEHDAFWAAARKALGDKDGTLELIDVLMLHRSTPAGQVLAGIRAAVGSGAASADVVALEARLAGSARTAPDAARAGETVVFLDGRRPAWPEDARPLPSLDPYDTLLPSRRRTREEKTA